MTAEDFLKKHGMEPERIDIGECAGLFLEGMEAGLAGGQGGLPMAPAYISCDDAPPRGVPVAVMDAGGTNFRRALVEFTDTGWEARDLMKTSMPGVNQSASWDEFVAFAADALMPMMDSAQRIGFCFSYMADISPDCDGTDPRFTKQVSITGCQGRHICAELSRELARRGVEGKKFVLLNDTAAVLLGVSALLDREKFDGFIGLVAGTGVNTCCPLPEHRIGKLGLSGDNKMLVNMESGYLTTLPRGDFDRVLDGKSGDPGKCLYEKMTSGAYLGKLTAETLFAAADEGLISQKIKNIPDTDSSAADDWCDGQGLENYTDGPEETEFIKAVSLALFDRAARCLCANLAGVLMLTGAGREKPVCICVEGSLFLKSRHFRPLLEKHMDEYVRGVMGRKYEFHTTKENTLLGAAAAALTN